MRRTIAGEKQRSWNFIPSPRNLNIKQERPLISFTMHTNHGLPPLLLMLPGVEVDYPPDLGGGGRGQGWSRSHTYLTWGMGVLGMGPVPTWPGEGKVWMGKVLYLTIGGDGVGVGPLPSSPKQNDRHCENITFPRTIWVVGKKITPPPNPGSLTVLFCERVTTTRKSWIGFLGCLVSLYRDRDWEQFLSYSR